MKNTLMLLLPLLFSGTAWGGDALSVDDATRDAFSRPIPGLNDSERETFFRGRTVFRQSWVIAPAKDASVAGLGPVYNRLSCASCHPRNGRGRAPDGPGERMQSMLVRLSVPGADEHGGPNPHPAYGGQLNEEGIPGVPGEGRAEVTWHETSVRLADGATVRLRQPEFRFVELAYGPLDGVLYSPRVGPPVFGLGLLDAVPGSELERLAHQPKPDGVKGKVNQVWDAAQNKTVAGRFGLKANAPNLRQQIAGAFVGDLGITSQLFPSENCTAVQAACQQAPSGGHPELSQQQLDDIEFYNAHLAPPARRNTGSPQVRAGEKLFAQAGCAVCHRPELTTGKQARFPRLANRRFSPYTDLLVHDMGEDLADHRPDYLANGREWRTPPLWGIGLVESVNEHHTFLHDGRARNLEEAILWHGGEGKKARDRYAAFSQQERDTLLAFLNSL